MGQTGGLGDRVRGLGGVAQLAAATGRKIILHKDYLHARGIGGQGEMLDGKVEREDFTPGDAIDVESHLGHVGLKGEGVFLRFYGKDISRDVMWVLFATWQSSPLQRASRIRWA